MFRKLLSVPVTLVGAIAALGIAASPSLASALELNFESVADGRWWQLITGHFTHYDGNHLFWDLLMFVGLGFACEQRHGKWFAPAILVTMLAIAAGIRLFCPDITTYRGLSGLDTGLFVWFVADQCRDRIKEADYKAMLLWLVPSLGLLGKMVFEAVTGQTLFVDSSGFVPLVESHLAGAVAGLIVFAASAYRASHAEYSCEPLVRSTEL